MTETATVLAYNELAYSVTIQDLGDYPRPSRPQRQMLYRLVRNPGAPR